MMESTSKNGKKRNHSGFHSSSSTSKANDSLEPSNIQQAVVKKKNRNITLTFPRWLYCYGPIVTVIVALVASIGIHHKSQRYVNEKVQTIGIEILDIFANFDKDGDFYLSLEEAEPLLLQFVDQSKNKDSSFHLDVVTGEKSVMIYASFRPLDLSTMTKDFEHDLTGNKSFTGLFDWQSVSSPSREYSVSKFLNLLPSSGSEITPGTIYDIVATPKGFFGSSNLPSDRFYPPVVMGVEFFLHRLLSMFHPRPFIIMRFPPQGVKGCVRAVNEDFIEVAIRMHVEFQLNEPPNLPFWFTPAQLTGTLIMARNGSEVRQFHLYLPHERRLNVDMEWLVDDKNQENMEVDIGYMPLMELTSQAPRDESDGEVDRVMDDADILWDSEISTHDAFQLLEESFFPFKKLKYYNISESFHIAKRDSKLVHSILLWGALDDQSC